MAKPKVKFEPLADFAYDLSPEDPREWDILVNGESVGTLFGLTDVPEPWNDSYKLVRYETEFDDGDNIGIDVWQEPEDRRYGAEWTRIYTATEAKKFIKQAIELRYA